MSSLRLAAQKAVVMMDSAGARSILAMRFHPRTCGWSVCVHACGVCVRAYVIVCSRGEKSPRGNKLPYRVRLLVSCEPARTQSEEWSGEGGRDVDVTLDRKHHVTIPTTHVTCF